MLRGNRRKRLKTSSDTHPRKCSKLITRLNLNTEGPKDNLIPTSKFYNLPSALNNQNFAEASHLYNHLTVKLKRRNKLIKTKNRSVAGSDIVDMIETDPIACSFFDRLYKLRTGHETI